MRRNTTIALLMGLTFLVACGRKPNTEGLGTVTIALASNSESSPVPPGSAATVTATVYDQNNQGVTWTIAPLNFGKLDNQTSTNQSSNFQTVASVTFTAPTIVSTNTTVTITATSISNPNVTASLSFKVIPITVDLFLLNGAGVEVPAAATTLTQGQQLPLFAQVFNEPGTTSEGVTWSLSPPDGGSLLLPTIGSVTYVAPGGLSSPTTVSVIATSITDSSAIAGLSITVFPSGGGPNVAAIQVNGGPVPGQVYANRAFTSVTICNPGSEGGSATCQTIDGILVDTGSYGLRVLQSKIPLLKLPPFSNGNGSTLENCSPLVDGSYLWGPVSLADIYVAGEVAINVPVQVIANSGTPGMDTGVPDGCSNGGTAANTPQLLGANGVLGVGPEPTDCTLASVNYCDGSTQPTPPNLYYSCFSTGCGANDSPVTVAATQQVTNPVISFTNNSSFSSDTQGVVIQLPPVSGAEASVTGQLIFGINSESNNTLGQSTTIFTLDSNDHFTTIFNGQSLTSSFIDSGSNALFFPDSLPTCPVNSQFFCPSSTQNLSAMNQGATQGQSTVVFSVDNADSLYGTHPDDAALGTLAGPEKSVPACSSGTSCSFDWGLPFFFGRTVYTVIDGAFVSAAPKGPWWAY